MTDSAQNLTEPVIVAEPSETPLNPSTEAAAATPPIERLVSQEVYDNLPDTTKKVIEAALRKGLSTPGNKVDMQAVRIYPTHVDVEIKGLWKSISVLDFKKLLDQQLQTETQMSMMILPRGAYMIAQSLTEMRVGIYIPERKADMKHVYGGAPTVYKNVCMPNVIISVVMKRDKKLWRVVSVKYFCTSKPVEQLPTDRLVNEADYREQIWRMPYPNFYEDYRMCYGGNIVPMEFNNNLRGLAYYYDVITISPFNNDLGIPIRDYDIPDWFNYLSQQEKFDYTKFR